jgi:hypothetical protein
LRIIQFCHANNKQVTGGSSNFGKIQFWQNFQTTLVLLIPIIVLAIA